jgi:hypothetical protein
MLLKIFALYVCQNKLGLDQFQYRDWHLLINSKECFSSLDVSMEHWGLNLFTSVNSKVEYILFCSIYAA